MKLSDYVAHRISEFGVRNVFMITGGGAMHLNHSLGTHPSLECIFNHHEQASAMAAESYYRLTNQLAVVNVTSGPGGTNTITGVHGAWTDSIGMVVISGQVKVATTTANSGLPLRQLGDQEASIVDLVKPITKYSVMLTEPEMVRYHLEKAFYLATHERPGPVWIDIPIDVQSTKINVDSLVGYESSDEQQEGKTDLKHISNTILKKLQYAKRPLIFVGGGVRLSGQYKAFIELVDKLGIPVVTGWNAHDLLWDDHPCYVGRPGTVGDRAGNFSVQGSDLLLILGSRLNIRQVSYNWASFASEAYKIWVDIDPMELQKPTVKPDLAFAIDLTEFLPELVKQVDLNFTKQCSHQEWLGWCKERVRRYPVVREEYWEASKINPYCFVESLFELLPENEIVVTANGTACVVGFQAAKLKKGQRLWTNSGVASMGYDLPAAIGACIGNSKNQTICLAGDGSIMMNLQELQTIIGLQLPIKIFLLNNSGYVSIRQTHDNYFKGVIVGADASSGVSFPDFEKLSNGFGIFYMNCSRHHEMRSVIDSVLAQSGPVICEVMLDSEYQFSPKLASRQLADGTMVSPSLEDMSPFLSESELQENRI